MEPQTSRGILYPNAGQKHFSLNRIPPSPDLAYFVEQYWIVTWDLRGHDPYLSQTLAYPSVHLSIEPQVARIVGVMTGKFTTLLEGEGRVFGIKFRPGGFHPFYGASVTRLTDRSHSLESVFGRDGTQLEAGVRDLDLDAERIALAEDFLRSRQPEREAPIEDINRAVDLTITNRGIKTVEDLAGQVHLSKRTLQRLFSQYVGVSPKWVIMRFRLHEAAEQLAAGQTVDLPQLAIDLGYFDQAHFIKDFKLIVGSTPAEYARAVEPHPAEPSE